MSGQKNVHYAVRAVLCAPAPDKPHRRRSVRYNASVPHISDIRLQLPDDRLISGAGFRPFQQCGQQPLQLPASHDLVLNQKMQKRLSRRRFYSLPRANRIAAQRQRRFRWRVRALTKRVGKPPCMRNPRHPYRQDTVPVHHPPILQVIQKCAPAILAVLHLLHDGIPIHRGKHGKHLYHRVTVPQAQNVHASVYVQSFRIQGECLNRNHTGIRPFTVTAVSRRFFRQVLCSAVMAPLLRFPLPVLPHDLKRQHRS